MGEINISYETRGRLTERMGHFATWMNAHNKKIQMWELAMLFESSKNEMYRLLRHSFARFRRHEEFGKIRTYYNEKVAAELARAKNEQERESAKTESTNKKVNGAGMSAEKKVPLMAEVEEEKDEANILVDSEDIIRELKHHSARDDYNE